MFKRETNTADQIQAARQAVRTENNTATYNMTHTFFIAGTPKIEVVILGILDYSSYSYSRNYIQ